MKARLLFVCGRGHRHHHFCSPAVASAQSQEAAVVESATNALTEFMSMPNEGIPRSMLANAQGLVIVPAMVKVGLVAGVRHGKGIAVIRDDNGVWRPPTFRVDDRRKRGLAGRHPVDRRHSRVQYAQERDRSVDAASSPWAWMPRRPRVRLADRPPQPPTRDCKRRSFRIRAVAACLPVRRLTDRCCRSTRRQINSTTMPPACGPTEQRPHPMRSSRRPRRACWRHWPRMHLRPTKLGAYAPTNVPGTPAAIPPAAPATTTPGVPADAAQDGLTATRLELVQAAQELGALLDESWRNYLSLPRGIFSGHAVPTVESLEQALKRFEAVAADNRYKVLLDRQEFQQLYGLLQTYTEQVRQASQPAGTSPSANTGFPVRIR